LKDNRQRQNLIRYAALNSELSTHVVSWARSIQAGDLFARKAVSLGFQEQVTNGTWITFAAIDQTIHWIDVRGHQAAFPKH
jgi:hypothetical protein